MQVGSLFRDFYITDVVKCVAQTRQIHGIPEHCCSEYLKEELIEKISRTPYKKFLIFTFGNVAYRFFQNVKIFELKKVFGKSEWDEDQPVTKRHGYLHLYTHKGIEEREKELFVIHLTHLSKRARIFTLRESYFDYLKEGLQSYQELI
jgi:uracil-DNA glycosylase